MVAQSAPKATTPTLEQKAADLTGHVELVARKGDVAVWWCPSWSGAADAHGDAFHVVVRQGQAAPRWHCDCPHGEHHPGAAACSHVRACQLWIERRGVGR